jgi:hypothetical protein
MDQKTIRLFRVLSVCTFMLTVLALVLAAIDVATDHTFPGYPLATAAIGFVVSWWFRYLVRSATPNPTVGPPPTD